MSFVSFSYMAFLPVVLTLYYLLPKAVKNPLLLTASYIFYACWSPIYSLLMLLSTAITYASGRAMDKEWLGRRRLWLVLSVCLNLAILFFFKYFDFYNDAIDAIHHLFGTHFPHPHPNFLLPVGISFYTFQALGYSMDVYRKDVAAEPNFITYALFVSFFPQLVAGPIERSGAILPQLRAPRRFSADNLACGMLPICWGVFKKLVIADKLAPLVAAVYAAPAQSSALQLALATFAFALQIYCDFSAYSDIARGSAKLFGINLMENFNRPYLATGIRDFWKRWHISLTSWFRDYLYVPLGGNRGSRFRHCRNVLIVFAVSGLWHGAAATYLLWGLLHGAYQLVGLWSKPYKQRLLAKLHIPEDNALLVWTRRGITFLLVCFAWIFFRADSVPDALLIVRRICTLAPGAASPIEQIVALGVTQHNLLVTALAACALFAVDLLGGRALEARVVRSLPLRYAALFALLAATLLFGAYGVGVEPSAFVYFQF